MNKLRIFFQLFLLIVFLAGIYVIIRTDTLFNERIANRQASIEMFTTDDVEDTSCPNLLLQRGSSILLYNTNMPLVDGMNPIKFDDLDGYIGYLEKQRAAGKICPVLFLRQESNTQGNDIYRLLPNPYDNSTTTTTVSPTTPPPLTNPALAPVTIVPTTTMQPQTYISAFTTQTQEIDPSSNAVPISSGYFNSGLSPYLPVQVTPTPTTNEERLVTNYIDADREHPPYNNGNYSGFDPTNLHIGVYTNLDKIHDSTGDVPISDNPMDPNWGGVLYTEEQVKSGKYNDYNIYKPMLYNPKVTYDVLGQNPFPPPTDIIE
uniref:Uncharacterized protein n=1 Tax=viral metagenome TaxID=1070528 RepID=A0A6C0DQL3_9ZZZZ